MLKESEKNRIFESIEREKVRVLELEAKKKGEILEQSEGENEMSIVVVFSGKALMQILVMPALITYKLRVIVFILSYQCFMLIKMT